MPPKILETELQATRHPAQTWSKHWASHTKVMESIFPTTP